MRSVTEPPAAANEILRAVRKGDLAALMSGLEQAEQMACYDPQTPSYTAEQLELLGAVATRMRCSTSISVCYTIWPGPRPPLRLLHSPRCNGGLRKPRGYPAEAPPRSHPDPGYFRISRISSSSWRTFSTSSDRGNSSPCPRPWPTAGAFVGTRFGLRDRYLRAPSIVNLSS